MTVLQAGLAGMIAAVLAVQLKGGKQEFGIYVSIGAGLLLFACIVDKLTVFIDTVEQIRRFISVDTGYIAIMMKMIGITYIAEFSSSICRDAGYQNIAVQIETFSKLTILALGMPVLLALLETIQEFLA